MEFNKEEKIRPKLGPEHKGKVVVIDVKSGDYEIADRHMTAALRLRKRRPSAFTWEEWVDVPPPKMIPPRVTIKRYD